MNPQEVSHRSRQTCLVDEPSSHDTTGGHCKTRRPRLVGEDGVRSGGSVSCGQRAVAASVC